MNEHEENEIKKQYLSGYLSSVRKEKEMEQSIKEYRMSKLSPSAFQDDGLPHGTGVSDLSDYIAELDRQLTELKEQMVKCLKQRYEIVSRIDMLTKESEVAVLKYRYIHGWSFERIAVELHYTYRHTTRIHGEALHNFCI